MDREGPGNPLAKRVSLNEVHDQTCIMPKAYRLALVQQPDPPVESVASADFSQTDGGVVEFAVVCSVVRASGSVVLTTTRRR